MPTSKNKKSALGRGFSSLIPTDLLDESFDPTADQDSKLSDLRQIKLDQIKPDPDQPRREFDKSDLESLAKSIEEHGVLQPIIVTPIKNGYKIVAGERRYRASQLAGLDKIPALVRSLSNQHRLELSLIENVQRQDLNPIEISMAYLKLRNQFNLSLEQIADKVGGSISAISNKLRLLKLPKSVQLELAKGNLTEGHVRPLIGLDSQVIESTVKKIIKEGWSSSKVEQFAVNLRKDWALNGKAAYKKINDTKGQIYEKQVNAIKSHLKTDVKVVTNSKGSGRLTIKFKDESEFKRIKDLLIS